MAKNSKPQIINTDVLIIGAGGAGLRAAIEATKNGAGVLVIAKEKMGMAHTRMAMGGLNVAVKAPATPEQHYKDTIEGGWKINNYKLAKIFSEEMPDRIYDLESYGVKFDKLPDGSFYTWAGGKQTAPLNLCAGDYTGREMINGLVSETNKLHIPYLDNHFVTKLFIKGKKVIGAYVIDLQTGEQKIIQAKATIIAAGGAGMMYLITTNEPTNTGEGYAWALDAGAELVDMEMVQIHPTGMADPRRKGKLITEKVRGHFGILKNTKGERFMLKYQPERKELAGRDEVSRAIFQEVAEGRGTKNGGVYLDITDWEEEKAEKVIPEVLHNFQEIGIDIRKEMMEVTPSMHHMMGGINIDEWGRTKIKGLYAVGEVTRNIHGANRLGGNSLAEGQVFGRRVGIETAKAVKKEKLTPIPAASIAAEIKRIHAILQKKKGASAHDIAMTLKITMWNDVGLIRDAKTLTRALKVIKNLQTQAKQVEAHDTAELREALETQEMLKTAEAVVIAALVRKESRGAHFRTDYPKMDPKWVKNIVVYRTSSGTLKTKVVPTVN